MQTRSVMVQTLCVPCHCHCRYCLLSWDGRAPGLDYETSEAYARRFYQWAKANRPELQFHFSFGYSMDHPRLPDALDFLREIGSVSAKFLQFDGMAFRSPREMEALLRAVKAHGVRELNFTFYGTEAYHDRFAGRKGDFAFMLSTVRQALAAGLNVSAGIPLTHENAGQAEPLLFTLREAGLRQLRFFVPHSEGRGASLDSIRFSQADAARLPSPVAQLFNASVYRTEGDWTRSSDLMPEENRSLLLSLTPNNIGKLESLGFEAVIAQLEALDDAYYQALPSFPEMLARCGNPEGKAYYSKRDLFQHYQKRYIQEHGLRLYDVTDERQSGSRRY